MQFYRNWGEDTFLRIRVHCLSFGGQGRRPAIWKEWSPHKYSTMAGKMQALWKQP
jgi:hypothetical protein